MSFLNIIRGVVLLILILVYCRGYTKTVFENIDRKYHLVVKSHTLAKALFTRGRTNYDGLKNTSVFVMDTFLNLVHVMNTKMAKQLRNSIIKFYRLKNLQDFTNHMITLEEVIDMVEHCLTAPVEMIAQLREQFHRLIKNFEDVRHFDTVNKCHIELPDEVAVAHCILHQAVLFNETMQDSLVSIVGIKTYQHARRINASLYEVQACLNSFVPNFFEQLLVDTYTDKCGYLKIVNASIRHLIKDEWRKNKEILFPKKWTPLIDILKEKSLPSEIDKQLLLETLHAMNLTSQDDMKPSYL